MKTLAEQGKLESAPACTHHNALVVREKTLCARDKAHVVLYCYLCESLVEAHVSELCDCMAAHIDHLLPNQLDWSQQDN
jgi:hypothetical protein